MAADEMIPYMALEVRPSHCVLRTVCRVLSAVYCVLLCETVTFLSVVLCANTLS